MLLLTAAMSCIFCCSAAIMFSMPEPPAPDPAGDAPGAGAIELCRERDYKFGSLFECSRNMINNGHREISL